jgi:hypothetical protein
MVAVWNEQEAFMARMLDAFRPPVLFALLCFSGCAARRTDRFLDSSRHPITIDGQSIAGSWLQDAFQDAIGGLSKASRNNWNFRNERC